MVQTSDNSSSINSQLTPKEAAFHYVLERFVFDTKNLGLIKAGITKLIKGEITETQLKEQILSARLMMMKKIVQLFMVHNSSHEEKVRDLTQQVTEYKKLLKNIIPRLELLELKLSPNSSVSTSQTDVRDVKLESELLEQKLEQAMGQIDIELWLKVFPLNLNEEKVRDDYRFITQLFTVLGIYHDDLFNIEGAKRKDVRNISRIENLKFPLDLNDNLVKLGSIRNILGHGLYTLSPDDIELAYITYFQLVFYLFKEALGKKLIESNRVQIKDYIKQLIQDQIKFDAYITSVAFSELNKAF